MFSAREVLDIAIQIERNGEKIYRDAVAVVSDESLCSTLKWMAEEERSHAGWFAELKDGLQEENGRNLMAEAFGRELFDDVLKNRSFSLEEVDFSQIEHRQQLLETFIEFEKDSVLFYQVLQPFVRDAETSQKLEMIISEERRHIEMLQSLLDDAALAAAAQGR